MTIADEAEMGDMASVLIMSVVLAFVLIVGGMFLYNNNILGTPKIEAVDPSTISAPAQIHISNRGQEAAMPVPVIPSAPGAVSAPVTQAPYTPPPAPELP